MEIAANPKKIQDETKLEAGLNASLELQCPVLISSAATFCPFLKYVSFAFPLAADLALRLGPDSERSSKKVCKKTFL